MFFDTMLSGNGGLYNYMFDLGHILYMVISGLISAAILFLMHKYFKTDDKKTAALKFFAIITVIIHYSSLWVDYLRDNAAEIESPMLFPIYPCNVCMWLLVAVAFMKNKNSKVFQVLSEFLVLGGTVCGSIGIILNENYDSTPNLLDYDVLKGLLSHSTMLIGIIYLLVAGFVKIRVKNVISVVIGLSIFFVDGLLINTLYAIFDLDPCNSMYLLEAPFSDIPWLITPVMGIMGIIVAFAITATYEQLALPKEERWYSLLKARCSKKESSETEAAE